MKLLRNNKIIIICLISIICLMMVGYAAYNKVLNIKGTTAITSIWDIRITNVKMSNKEGEAEEVGDPTWNDLTAYMEANLHKKGDSITYDVTISNRGTLDDYLNSINNSLKTNNEAIIITIEGYTKGEKLLKGEDKVIKVTMKFNPNFNGKPEEGSSEVDVDFN